MSTGSFKYYDIVSNLINQKPVGRNVASISGVMDLATYGGGGIGSLIYGFVIKGFGYTPMFVSWIVISVISIIILRTLKEKENI